MLMLHCLVHNIAIGGCILALLLRLQWLTAFQPAWPTHGCHCFDDVKEIGHGVRHTGAPQLSMCCAVVDLLITTVSPACRWVVHWDVPSSLEGFYQVRFQPGEHQQSSKFISYASTHGLLSLYQTLASCCPKILARRLQPHL
eukprot:GHRQ01023754.1.p1 GENE.GHRQ01023754.1~~GHRQ01023754.1.p1  ORF type:complete len:142 (-),score=6.89 GHRQ01023754.1:240-665(-)